MEEQDTTMDDPGWFVDTRFGRLILSVLFIAFMYFVVVWNLPDGDARDLLRPPLQETVWVVGIGQDWGVFAPNPVSTSYRVEADVTFADGTVERYEFPHGDPFVGAYREFRWRKFESRVRRDENRRLLRPTALWIREQYSDRDVTNIVLYRRTRKVPEPGSGTVSVWQDEEMLSVPFAVAGS